MRNISQAAIRDIPVPLPPLPEQRRIAAILDQADAVRRARREAIGLTEELLRSVFLEMLELRFRAVQESTSFGMRARTIPIT